MWQFKTILVMCPLVKVLLKQTEATEIIIKLRIAVIMRINIKVKICRYLERYNVETRF